MPYMCVSYIVCVSHMLCDTYIYVVSWRDCWLMTHSYVWLVTHDSWLCGHVSWPHSSLTHSYVWHDHHSHKWMSHESWVNSLTSTYMTNCWLMTHDSWLIHMRDMTHSYVWHDSFICVTHDSFICDTHISWCESWVRHMCDMTLCVPLPASSTMAQQSIAVCVTHVTHMNQSRHIHDFFAVRVARVTYMCVWHTHIRCKLMWLVTHS